MAGSIIVAKVITKKMVPAPPAQPGKGVADHAGRGHGSHQVHDHDVSRVEDVNMKRCLDEEVRVVAPHDLRGEEGRRERKHFLGMLDRGREHPPERNHDDHGPSQQQKVDERLFHVPGR